MLEQEPAQQKARRIDPEADVKIFQEESVVSYGACGIPYVIEGLISNFEKLIERPPDAFKSKYDVDVLTNLIIVGAFDYSWHTWESNIGLQCSQLLTYMFIIGIGLGFHINHILKVYVKTPSKARFSIMIRDNDGCRYSCRNSKYDSILYVHKR